MSEDYEFDSEVWLWSQDGKPAWYFVTVPPEHSADLRLEGGPPRGFGSLRVEARIGASVWRTSVFPQSSSGCYMLPLKKAVRNAEGLDHGDSCAVTLRLVE